MTVCLNEGKPNTVDQLSLSLITHLALWQLSIILMSCLSSNGNKYL